MIKRPSRLESFVTIWLLFWQVCDGPALKLFRFEELELLVCGLPHLDFGALKSGAKVILNGTKQYS